MTPQEQVQKIVWLAFLGTQVMFVMLITLSLPDRLSPAAGLSALDSELLNNPTVLGLSVTAFLLLVLHRILPATLSANDTRREFIFRMVFLEAVGLLGVMCAFLTRNPYWGYLFLACDVLLMLASAPRGGSGEKS